MHGQRRLSDEEWFERYGALVGASQPLSSLAFEDESEFASIVRPLEDRYGRPLTGHGRQTCHRAFRENPESFRGLAQRALEQASRNPVGLLLKMIRDGEHRFWNVPPSSGTSVRAKAPPSEAVAAKRGPLRYGRGLTTDAMLELTKEAADQERADDESRFRKEGDSSPGEP